MKSIVTLITMCISLTLFSQNYNFGKVSKDELMEKFNPIDSSASATYLYKHRRSHYDYVQGEGFVLVTNVHERIKIYNKEGFRYATKVNHLYHSGGNEENVYGLKAYTYNLIDGKIEEVKLKKDGIFKTELSKYYNEHKFTMPHIKEGTIIEYKYEIKSPFYSMVDEFEFQKDIPIKTLEAKFETPEYFNFKVNTKGFLSVVPKRSSKSGKITFTSKQRSSGAGASTFSTSDVDYQETVWDYNLENIPALKDEPYVNNINNYRSSAKYELSYTKFPNSTMEHFSTTWEDVVKRIYKSSNFGEELNKTGYFEKDIDALINDISDPMKRANLIYNFVKSQVKWNNYYGKYTNVGVRKAYKEHTGNVAEINLMLTAMLRYAGLDANPVLVSTRKNGIPLFPTREGYDYIVSGIEVPNDVILLDATIKNGSPNILPFRALNWMGRIIRKSGSSATVDLYPKKKSKVASSLMVNLDLEGTIDGSLRISKTGHKALSYRASNGGNDEDKAIEKIENKYDGIEVDEFDVKNKKDLAKPVIETIKFTMDDQADIVNDKIYFSPFFFLKTSDNPFKLETREFPVDFGYPTSSSYRIIVNLPEGYKVESLPESKGGKLPEGQGDFMYRIVDGGSKVNVTLSSNINSAIISSLYYPALKEYFKNLIEKENEQIVLTRI